MKKKNKKSQPEQSSGVFLGPPNGTTTAPEVRGIRPICRNKNPNRPKGLRYFYSLQLGRLPRQSFGVLNPVKANKKGWLRILEAVIAILIVFGAVMYIVSKQNYAPDRTQEIYEKEDSVLQIISRNDSLRQMVIDQQNDRLDQEIAKMMPASWNFSTCIVGNILLICTPTTPRDREIYVKEVLIVSTVQKYSPKKLRLFVWMK